MSSSTSRPQTTGLSPDHDDCIEFSVSRFEPSRSSNALAQYDGATTFLNAHGQVLEIRNDKGEVKGQIIAPEVQLQLKLIDKIRALLKDCGLSATDATCDDLPPKHRHASSAAPQPGGSRNDPTARLMQRRVDQTVKAARTWSQWMLAPSPAPSGRALLSV